MKFEKFGTALIRKRRHARRILAAVENAQNAFTKRVISGHPVYNVTSRSSTAHTQSMFITTKKSSSMHASWQSVYAIALIYRSAAHVQ